MPAARLVEIRMYDLLLWVNVQSGPDFLLCSANKYLPAVFQNQQAKPEICIGHNFVKLFRRNLDRLRIVFFKLESGGYVHYQAKNSPDKEW